MSATSAVSAVSKGAALLDAQRPGWYNSIDLDTLDMASCNSCILGQLYGSYDNGLHALFSSGDYLHIPTRSGHGFTTGTERWEYGVLDDEWKRVILARRGTPTHLTIGEHRFTVAEAIRLGREVRENDSTAALVELLISVSGGDRATFMAVFGSL